MLNCSSTGNYDVFLDGTTRTPFNADYKIESSLSHCVWPCGYFDVCTSPLAFLRVHGGSINGVANCVKRSALSECMRLVDR